VLHVFPGLLTKNLIGWPEVIPANPSVITGKTAALTVSKVAGTLEILIVEEEYKSIDNLFPGVITSAPQSHTT